MNALNEAMEAAAEEMTASTAIALQEDDLTRHIRVHRKAVEHYGFRALEAMKRCKEDLADIKAQKAALIAAHRAALEALREREDQCRIRAAEEAKTAHRLAAASRMALMELEK
jgi:hypothetical protein